LGDVDGWQKEQERFFVDKIFEEQLLIGDEDE